MADSQLNLVSRIQQLTQENAELKAQLHGAHAALGASRIVPDVLHGESAVSVGVLSPLVLMCGIYFLVRAGVVVYVGQSIDAINRISHHKHVSHGCFDSVWFMACAECRLDMIEKYWIRKLQPELNTHGTNKVFKSYKTKLAGVANVA